MGRKRGGEEGKKEREDRKGEEEIVEGGRVGPTKDGEERMHVDLRLCVCVCARVTTEGQARANRKTYRDGGARRGNKYIKIKKTRVRKGRER